MARTASDLSLESDLRELMKLLPLLLGGLKRGGPPPLGRPHADETGGSAVPGLSCSPSNDGGLGPRHVPVLIQLIVDGELSVSQLADRLGVTLAAASLMVGELDRCGLVERREDAADRRRTLVAVAPARRAQLEAWLELRRAPIRTALGRLPGADRAAMLRGIRSNVVELRDDADPAPDR